MYEPNETAENIDTILVEPDSGSKAISVLYDLLLQARYIQDENKTNLLTESAAQNIAWMQGACAGINDCLHTLHKAGFNLHSSIYHGIKMPWVDDTDTCVLTYEKLSDVCSAITELQQLAQYQKFTELQKEIIERRKDWLYTQANKGRDLYWCKGWNTGFTWIPCEINRLISCKEARDKQKRAELPFDGGAQ